MKVKVFCQYSLWPRYRTIQTHHDRYTTLGQCLRAWWCSFRSRSSCLLPRYSPQIWRQNHGDLEMRSKQGLFFIIVYICLSIADLQWCFKILMIDFSSHIFGSEHTVLFRCRSPPSEFSKRSCHAQLEVILWHAKLIAQSQIIQHYHSIRLVECGIPSSLMNLDQSYYLSWINNSQNNQTTGVNRSHYSEGRWDFWSLHLSDRWAQSRCSGDFTSCMASTQYNSIVSETQISHL